MKQSIEYQNLALITDDFRNTGRALTGFKNLKADLNDFKLLENVLRDHRHSAIIKSSEIAYRDEVDFLLKYYSLLELGVITGYLPRELNLDIRNEVNDILGNKHVMKYYTEIYPLKLPMLLYKWSTNSFTQPVRANNINKEVFTQILLLDSLLDDDVEDFLWMLDSGVTDGKSISDLNALLSNKTQIGKLLEKPKEDEDVLDRSFWGFIKFTDYMVRYKKVIEQCDDELISSAVWHYQGYWFQNMKDMMKGRYIDAIRSIEKLKDDISPEEFFDARDNADIKVEYGQWQEQAGEEVNKIIESITYLLDQSNGDALNRYVRVPVSADVFISYSVNNAGSAEALIISDIEKTILHDVLYSMKISTFTIKSLDKALEMLSSYTPKFILMDLMIPTIDSRAMLEALQSFYDDRKKVKRPPIIMFNSDKKSIHIDIEGKEQTKLVSEIEQRIKKFHK